MSTPLRRMLSLTVGWLADRKVPTPLRNKVYRTYARITGADLSESRGPLEIYPSLGAFFVRRLIEGARPIDGTPEHLTSPVDGKVQDLSQVQSGSVLQAKGKPYEIRELLGGVGSDLDLEGGQSWTLYLGPKDYHRIHAPESGKLVEVRTLPGARYSVAPKVLERYKVLSINERCVLRLETARGPILMVLVGALNVGRIRVLGVDPKFNGVLPNPLKYGRGEEVARFEMGSTVVLITPPGMAQPAPELVQEAPVRLGKSIGSYS